MEQWDYAVENVRALDLADTFERYTEQGWELVSIVVQEYVETINTSPETGSEQKALIAALYHVVAKKRQPAEHLTHRQHAGLSH